jgi:SH3-like domain-containing protein
MILIWLTISVFMFACGIVTLSPAKVNTGIYTYTTNTATNPVNATQTPANASNRCYGIIIAPHLNLRAKPDANSTPDGAGLVKNDIVLIVGYVGDWYKVEAADGRSGYAHSKYIDRPGCQ